MISDKRHAAFDVLISLFLISSPYLLRFSHLAAARNALMVLGAVYLLVSIATCPCYSIVKRTGQHRHCNIDMVLGGLLMLAPAAAGYAGRLTSGQLLMHFVVGFAIIAMAAITRITKPAAPVARAPEATRKAA